MTGRAGVTPATVAWPAMPAPECIEFRAGGARCVGDLWRADPPPGGAGGIVVLGHGLGATRAMGLAAYAERFAQAGLSALTFDYRHFGDSEGRPRGVISISRQLADWTAAIAFARELEGIDPARVAAWGSSFGGGHVLTLATRDLGLAAVVAQCPFTDGIASALTIAPASTARVMAAAVADLLAALRGAEPIRVAAAGRRGQAALMTAPDAQPGYERLLALDPAPHPGPAARFALRVPAYRPGRRLNRVGVPTLMCVCDPDTVAPTATTARHFRRAGNPHLVLRSYPYGHFDIYSGEPFEQVVSDQVEFLRTRLQPAADASPRLPGPPDRRAASSSARALP